MKVMAVIAALCVFGCGLTQTRGPDPQRPANERPKCTESMDLPKRDGYVAGVATLAVLFGLLAYKASDRKDLGVNLMVVGGAVMAGSYVSAAIGGYRVKKCRKAIRNFEQQRPAQAAESAPR